MKTFTLLVIISAVSLTGYAQTKKHVPAKKKAAATVAYKLHTTMDTISYAYGMDLYLRRNQSLIKDVQARGIKTLNFTAFNQAITDELAEKNPVLTNDQARLALLKNLKTKFADNAVAGNAFMAENKTKPGVITLPDGLQYMVLQEGSGPKITLKDSALVMNYVLKLSNGKQIESTLETKKPFALPALKGVIPGWIEGLQLMNKGAKYRLFIPYNLGYGDFEGYPQIPPYSSLIFDVEVVSFSKQ